MAYGLKASSCHPLKLAFNEMQRSTHFMGKVTNVIHSNKQRTIAQAYLEKWTINLWCDQAKSVWSWLDSNFFNLPDCVHHLKSYILQKTQLKLDI